MRPAMLVLAFSLAISVHAQNAQPKADQDDPIAMGVRLLQQVAIANTEALTCESVADCHDKVRALNKAWQDRFESTGKVASQIVEDMGKDNLALARKNDDLTSKLKAAMLLLSWEPKTAPTQIIQAAPVTTNPPVHCFSWKLGENTTTDCY